MADDPDQQRQLPLLERSIAGELGEMEEEIAVRQTRGLSAAQQLVLANGSRGAQDQVRPVAAALQAAEYGKRDARSAASEASGRAALLTFLASGLMAPAILGIFYYQVRRSLHVRAHLFAEERAARREAQAANRVKDEFLATVSHELRTPLNAILGWAHILRGGTLDTPGFARGLDVIERNARAQAQLIEDLLDVSRIISGKLRLEPRPLDLVSVVEAAVDAVRPAAEARKITITRVLDGGGCPVAVDGDRMQQVVWNLLSNAVKFTPEGGHVEARLRRVDSRVELTVRDDGRGIDAEFLPHAFDLFRQADAGSVRTQTGLGLGLAIARRIVEMHGGTIQASSPGSGKGAVFTVTLPCRAGGGDNTSAPEARPGARAAPSHPDLRGLRFLAVDDQRDTLDVIREVLSHCGAEVGTAESARAAFDAVQAWRPDVLVTDISMPGDDGFALIRWVRALAPEKGGKTPAVALTAFARGEDRRNALSAGFQVHVPKPVEPSELATVVASLAERLRPESCPIQRPSRWT